MADAPRIHSAGGAVSTEKLKSKEPCSVRGLRSASMRSSGIWIYSVFELLLWFAWPDPLSPESPIPRVSSKKITC